MYRNNGKPAKAEEVHRKPVDVQNEIPKLMIPISAKVDVKDLCKTIDLNLEGLSVKESIVRLTQMIILYKKDEMKEKVIDDYKKNPFIHSIRHNIINASGQTVVTIPPLDITNIDSDEGLLDQHINQKIVEEGKIAGD